MNKFFSWWLTPKLPKVHHKPSSSGLLSMVKHWYFHPIKRRVAKYYLLFLRGLTNVKVVAITGSAGKTTTKEVLAGILSTSGKTVWTKDNIDPVYNIPTTILKCGLTTKYLVLEMGVEYPGEMDFYLWLARPDVGVITNIFPTHTEFFKSIDGVFREKSKLVKSLPSTGAAILNKSDEYLKRLQGKLNTKIIWFEKDVDILTQNITTAVLVSKFFGLGKDEIQKGLKKVSFPKHRLAVVRSKSGATILDDSYNSNPEALLSVLREFTKVSGKRKKIIVLGDMLELGDLEKSMHIKIGNEISKYGIDTVIGVGKAVSSTIRQISKCSPQTKVYLFEKQTEVDKVLKPLLNKNSYLLVKGSRSICLDKLIDRLV